MSRIRAENRSEVATKLRELAERIQRGEIPAFALVYFDPNLVRIVVDPIDGETEPQREHGEHGECRTLVVAQDADEPQPARRGHFTAILTGLLTIRHDVYDVVERLRLLPIADI